MKYQHSAFIENTPEAREWLEKISAEKGYVWSADSDMIFCTWGFYMTDRSCRIDDFKMIHPDLIDCRQNLPLFKAVTAMREDSELMQWFTNPDIMDEWWFNDEYSDGDFDPYRKATLEELIEYFKN